MSEKRQERTVSKLAIQKAHHFKAAWIIFERPGDAMSYFSTEEVDNLKSLRAMVTEDLINETDYEDAKGTILAVAKKRRLSAAPKASADSTATAESATSSPAASAAPASATPSPSGDGAGTTPPQSTIIKLLILKKCM